MSQATCIRRSLITTALSLLLPRPSCIFVTSASFASARMTMFTTERSDGTITVSPRNEGDQSGLVVICHGLGDTAEGFIDVAEQFAQDMPHLKFILPTAPTQPVTMNMGMAMPSWYDITGLDERSNEICKGIQESQNRIVDILRQEHETMQLPYNRMVLAGFSQGGALSLFTGMQLSQPLAGILMMSAYLPAAKQFQITSGLHHTPILHLHGDADPLVTLAVAQKSKTLVTNEKGATDYEMKVYPRLAHSVNMQELADAKQFLFKVLPPDSSCKVVLKDPSTMSIKELKAAIRKAGLSHKAIGLVEKHEYVKLVQDHRQSKI